MHLLEILLIALGLSLDSFAVSVAAGTILGNKKRRPFVRIACYMGFFQGALLWLGWHAGGTFQHYIKAYDHWVAFGLLSIIGLKMIYEGSIDKKEDTKSFDPTRALTLIGLAFATSIDALAVGISFAMLNYRAPLMILSTATITFGMSFWGAHLGSKVGNKIRLRIEIIGGTILVLIGLRILLEHLELI